MLGEMVETPPRQRFDVRVETILLHLLDDCLQALYADGWALKAITAHSELTMSPGMVSCPETHFTCVLERSTYRSPGE